MDFISGSVSFKALTVFVVGRSFDSPHNQIMAAGKMSQIAMNLFEKFFYVMKNFRMYNFPNIKFFDPNFFDRATSRSAA